MKIWQTIQRKAQQWQEILIAASVAGLTISCSLIGLFQLLEWAALDYFFRLRPTEPLAPHIILVTIDESELTRLGQWPLSDALLAELLKKVKAQQPRAIGLDLYRNFPVEPGHQELVSVFQSTPNLVGVEKAVNNKVPPPPALKQLDQIAFTDILIDVDGKVRRALVSIRQEDGEIKLGLGTKLALMYLEEKGITLERAEHQFLWWQQEQLKLGDAVFIPFQGNDGGYVRADAGGYQILLNFRGLLEKFRSVSLSDVLERRIPPDLMRNCVVLIGSTAESLNDRFYTPYSSSLNHSPKRTPGLLIHANITSQLLSAALDGRPLLQVWPDPAEWLWIVLWSFMGAIGSRTVLEKNRLQQHILVLFQWTTVSVLLPSSILLSVSYLAFLSGWWLPIVTPLLALGGSAIASAGYRHYKLENLASTDDLTQLINRRYFNKYLEREWDRQTKLKKELSLILCDVDYFKRYNDTYGHQSGDECLQQVAQALHQAVRANDLVARYGGEEFAIILPNANAQIATQVAQRICFEVKALQIPHAQSHVSPYVTLSCGIACTFPEGKSLPQDLIATADRALYEAKEQGRDRVYLGCLG